MSTKRRRVYSLEPKFIVQTMFARNYLNHFLPALTKIKNCISLHDNVVGQDSDQLAYETVRYEADMALVMSTPEFAWSHALKNKLQKNINVGRFYHPSMHGPSQHISIDHCLPSLPHHAYPRPSVIKAKVKKIKKDGSKKLQAAAEKSKQQQIGSRLDNLRSLVPGGNEMGSVDELLSEMGSYILCLELQVNILRCLADT